MGLFSNKQAKKTPQEKAAADAAAQVFDEQFRQELRQLGRDHFKRLLEESSTDLKQDVDATMSQAAADIKDYMTRQLDLTVTRVNTELTNQMNERISEFNRIASESQDMLAKSLSQNAQAVHEKYQQLSASLQQTVSNQEVMMVSVFEANKAQVSSTQAEQDRALKTLSASIESTTQQSQQLGQTLQQTVTQQAASLNEVYQENLSQVQTTRDAQAKALETLNASVMALHQQHQQLSQLLERSIANHKAMVIETLNENMASIIEHYLVGALGEQTDLKDQLPSILEQLEKSKQDMVDDMKL